MHFLTGVCAIIGGVFTGEYSAWMFSGTDLRVGRVGS